MKVDIIERAPATLACLRYVGPYGEAVGRFWDDVYAPWAAANGFGIGHARYGVGHDDPTVTAPEHCRYDACTEVDPGFTASGDAFVVTLPGGRHAVTAFKGTSAQIGPAWDALLRTWLPASGLRHGPSPSFEYYPQGAFFDPATGEFACELYVPLA
jgi:AraC family transcriptional regulator